MRHEPAAGLYSATRTDVALQHKKTALLRFTSELPPEPRRVLRVETWRPSKHLACSLLQAIQVERRCPRLWRPRLWLDVGTYNRFYLVGAGSSSFFLVHPAA